MEPHTEHVEVDSIYLCNNSWCVFLENALVESGVNVDKFMHGLAYTHIHISTNESACKTARYFVHLPLFFTVVFYSACPFPFRQPNICMEIGEL